MAELLFRAEMGNFPFPCSISTKKLQKHHQEREGGNYLSALFCGAHVQNTLQSTSERVTSRRISTGSCTSCHCCPSLAPETQPQFHSKNSHAQALPAHQAHGVVQRAGTPKTQSSAPSSVTYSLDTGWGNLPRRRTKPTTLSPKRSKFPIRAAANSGSQQEESFLKRYNPGFLC